MDRAPLAGPFSCAEIAGQDGRHRNYGKRQRNSEDVAHDVGRRARACFSPGAFDMFVVHLTQTIR